MASRIVVRKKIPKGILICFKKKYRGLKTILFTATIMHTNAARRKLLSSEIFLDNSIIKKLHNGNINKFRPNALIQKQSFKAPAKILKSMAHLNGKAKVATTALIKSRSGLTLNTWKESRSVACNNAKNKMARK